MDLVDFGATEGLVEALVHATGDFMVCVEFDMNLESCCLPWLTCLPGSAG